MGRKLSELVCAKLTGAPLYQTEESVLLSSWCCHAVLNL